MTLTMLAHHWKAAVVLWLIICAVNGMPSPNGTGPTSTWWYKWMFGATHLATAGVPRVIATMFPQFSKLLPGSSVPEGKP